MVELNSVTSWSGLNVLTGSLHSSPGGSPGKCQGEGGSIRCLGSGCFWSIDPQMLHSSSPSFQFHGHLWAHSFYFVEFKHLHNNNR